MYSEPPIEYDTGDFTLDFMDRFSDFVRDPSDSKYADQLEGLMAVAEYAYLFDHLINQCLRKKPVYDGYATRLREHVLDIGGGEKPHDRGTDSALSVNFRLDAIKTACTRSFGAHHDKLMMRVLRDAMDEDVSDWQFLMSVYDRVAKPLYATLNTTMKVPLTRDLYVYRGMELSGEKGAGLEMREEYRNINGQVLAPTSFTSTSLYPQAALEFCTPGHMAPSAPAPACPGVRGVMLKIRLPRGTPVVPMLLCGLEGVGESEIAIASPGKLVFENDGDRFKPASFRNYAGKVVSVMTADVVFRKVWGLPGTLPHPVDV